MTDAEATEALEWTCDIGKCDPSHPLHCCHVAIGTVEPAGRRGFVLSGWECVDCKKRSKVSVMVNGECNPDRRGL